MWEGVGESDRPNRGETKDSFMGEKRNGDVLKQRLINERRRKRHNDIVCVWGGGVEEREIPNRGDIQRIA